MLNRSPIILKTPFIISMVFFITFWTACQSILAITWSVFHCYI